ncbi:MAG: hypothetical protein Q7R49_02165 [Candidatus Daviesbacteria bacterium]|nr:hypothetical protein [Candidatus Daviesbacteria bacterium]
MLQEFHFPNPAEWQYEYREVNPQNHSKLTDTLWSRNEVFFRVDHLIRTSLAESGQLDYNEPTRAALLLELLHLNPELVVGAAGYAIYFVRGGANLPFNKTMGAELGSSLVALKDWLPTPDDTAEKVTKILLENQAFYPHPSSTEIIKRLLINTESDKPLATRIREEVQADRQLTSN